MLCMYTIYIINPYIIQRLNMEQLMAQKLGELGNNTDADQSELAEILKKYTEIYADYGKYRQKEVGTIILT